MNNEAKSEERTLADMIAERFMLWTRRDDVWYSDDEPEVGVDDWDPCNNQSHYDRFFNVLNEAYCLTIANWSPVNEMGDDENWFCSLNLADGHGEPLWGYIAHAHSMRLAVCRAWRRLCQERTAADLSLFFPR